jgi:hypothetical protein
VRARDEGAHLPRAKIAAADSRKKMSVLERPSAKRPRTHGYGHRGPGSRMQVANAHAGVDSNRLTDELAIEALSGNAVLNGIPVEVSPVQSAPERLFDRIPT